MASFRRSLPVVAPAEPISNSTLNHPAAQATPGWRSWLAQPCWIYGLIALAMLLGGGLRLARLSHAPPGLNQDEAVYAYDAYSIFHTGRDHPGHPFPWAGVESFGPFSGAVLSFIEAPFVGVFGLHVDVVRGVSAGVDLLLVPIVALLAVELLESWTAGVAAAWVVALLPWAVENARFANLPSIVPAIDGLTLLLLVYALRHSSSRGIVAAAAAGCTAMATYHTMKVYLPLVVIAAIPIFWRGVRALSREAIVYAVLVTAFLGGPVLFLTAFDPGGRARADGAISTDNGFHSLAHRYLSYFSRHFLLFAGDGNRTHTPPGHGVLLWSLLPFLAAGSVTLVVAVLRPVNSWNRSPALFVLAALVLYPFPAFFTLPAPNAIRAVHLIPLLAVVAAAGFVALVNSTNRLARRLRLPNPALLPLAWIIPALIWLMVETGMRFNEYFTAYPAQVAGLFQFGLDDAVRYALAHQADYDQIWITNTNQPYIYVLFYASWPPADVHRRLVLTRDANSDNHITAIGKFHFPYKVGDPASNDILAAKLPVLAMVNDPSGKTAYLIRDGMVAYRGRVLVITKPQAKRKSGR